MIPSLAFFIQQFSRLFLLVCAKRVKGAFATGSFVYLLMYVIFKCSPKVEAKKAAFFRLENSISSLLWLSHRFNLKWHVLVAIESCSEPKVSEELQKQLWVLLKISIHTRELIIITHGIVKCRAFWDLWNDIFKCSTQRMASSNNLDRFRLNFISCPFNLKLISMEEKYKIASRKQMCEHPKGIKHVFELNSKRSEEKKQFFEFCFWSLHHKWLSL